MALTNRKWNLATVKKWVSLPDWDLDLSLNAQIDEGVGHFAKMPIKGS